MRLKGAKGEVQVGPKPQVGPPEPNFGPKSQQSQNGQKDPRTQNGQEPQVGHFQPPAQVQKGFPSMQGKISPSSMYPIPKDPGMVHIWYNIPLCTIFSQKSNGDVFRTQ
ncbi:hypothetical protein O181_045595 [Austropuccinia psidii MF-1]|uniref:Uncharacterized protein n=1 Tax=Austropuccinia psidii MF-1 TaxID=1389203 RepID=A0A9Q3DRP8_9BASI|nr:hypothetical protein [Austropuccinia psidii MF-1]